MDELFEVYFQTEAWARKNNHKERIGTFTDPNNARLYIHKLVEEIMINRQDLTLERIEDDKYPIRYYISKITNMNPTSMGIAPLFETEDFCTIRIERHPYGCKMYDDIKNWFD